ncbi:MAG: ATP-binding protein [Gammaproteobacteria bacterium]|nr:ATP-binding protein [Gammaproteobacteria bacterium]
MTSVRLRDDLDARSARLGTIRNIIRFVGSDLAPDSLFDAIVQEIRKVVDCQRCALGRRDPVTGRHEYWHIASDVAVEPLREEGEQPWEGAVVYRSLQPFYVADLANVEVTTRRRLLAAGLRSTLVVPITRDGVCIAHFSLSSTRPHAFSTEDIVLLGEISDCLATAIRNATLYRESREGAERLEIARNIAHAVASTLDPQLLFRVIAGHIRRAVACDRCDITRVDAHDEVASGSAAPDYVPDTRLSDRSEAARLAEDGFLSWLVVPVAQDGHCVARIELASRLAGAFSPREIDLLISVAHHVAPAIENARLHGEVRRGRDFFQSIFDDSADAMIIIGDHGRIQRANSASRRMLGYGEQELTGKDMGILIPDDRREEWRAFLHARSASAAFDVDAPVRCRDDSLLPAHVTVSPVVSARLGVIAYCAIVKDLSERDAHMKKLEASAAEMQRFFRRVSSDIASPLADLESRLVAARVSFDEGDTAQARAALVVALGACAGLRALLAALETLSRDAPEGEECADVSLTEVVDEALDRVDGPLAERGVAVRVAGELPVVYGERSRLREVLQNLVENAIRFTRGEAHPEIEIGATTTGRERVVYVRDNGIVIDPEQRENVFDVFRRHGGHGQGQTGSEAEDRGTGIGLAVVKQIVERHGGRVWLETAADGHGNTFKFTLPTRGE